MIPRFIHVIAAGESIMDEKNEGAKDVCFELFKKYAEAET